MRRASIGLFIFFFFIVFECVMAASSPESNRLRAAAASSPPSSSPLVDAVFSNLSPLKPGKAGPYWSRLTESETTLRSPQPVFTSPHLALHQETRLSSIVLRHCNSQVKDIDAPCLEKENLSHSPSESTGVYLSDPNTTHLEIKSANEAPCSQSGFGPKEATGQADDGDRGAEELVANSAHWANERFDDFPEFTAKDVNYVEPTMNIQPVGSYSIILNAIECDLQNAEENGFNSKSGDHNLSSRPVPNDDSMDINQNQRVPRRHLQFETLHSYGNPVTFRSHHYPSTSEGTNSSMLHLNGIDRSASIASHLNVSGLMSKQVMPQRSHDLTKNTDSNSASLTGSEQFSAQVCGDLQENRIVVARESSTHALQDTNRYAQASPKRKRKKGSMTSENEGCKRCNCKRSKCLKLYCECFAAGVYCVASCACTNCFNKPEYEDTVLDTRQQIESRNPLAFAPKIVKHAMDSPTYMVEDGNRTTPASARHKRGCNCKKSKCLKKYCECYQSKVGCSDGCRCDGCKNSFGAKTAYRRVERWRNESHEKPDTGQTSAPRREELDDTSNLSLTPIPHPASEAALFSGSSSQNQLLQLQGVMFQYPLAICTQQLYGSNILNDITNDYTSYENIMKNTTDPPLMLTDASTPSKAVQASSPNQKQVSPPKRSQEPGSSSLRNLRNGGKFILHGLPSFPPLSPCSTGENGSNDMENYGQDIANDQCK